jgi:UDP-N-acetylglucosamine--N-acetylmuramyl-(pentapeptide) pyrophosphoryl-undecaprenol N-acetylglucosamine transferase
MSGRHSVMIAAGGTGGHIFPAVALAQALVARGHEVAFVTDSRGAAIGPEQLGLPAGATCHTVPAGRIGGGLLRTMRGGFDIIAGTLAARRLIRRIGPAVAVGFGGYPSVPPMLAAGLSGVPTIIHEQNAVLGRANRRLARAAEAFALSFVNTRGIEDFSGTAAELVGNPVRADIAALRDRPYVPPRGTVELLIMGGSLGAHVFAEIVPAAFAELNPALRRRFRITQQCRTEDLDAVRAAYRGLDMAVELAPFFDDVPARLARAHLVVCRAGASTVAELTTAGRPALYVPYPSAADDHQTANARAIEATGGAWVLPQPEFTAGALAGWLEAAAEEPETLAQVAGAARAAAHPDAAERLADMVEARLPANGGSGNGNGLAEAAE